LKEER